MKKESTLWLLCLFLTTHVGQIILHVLDLDDKVKPGLTDIAHLRSVSILPFFLPELSACCMSSGRVSIWSSLLPASDQLPYALQTDFGRVCTVQVD